jgi:F0F1-type ATP synthase membrane subunit a
MTTIASYLVLAATQVTARHLGFASPPAVVQMASQPTENWKMTLTIAVLVIAILAALKYAVHGLSGLLAQLLRTLVALAYILFILGTALGIVVALQIR